MLKIENMASSVIYVPLYVACWPGKGVAPASAEA